MCPIIRATRSPRRGSVPCAPKCPPWKSGSVMIACRATSLNAMFCADRLGAAAITSACRMRCGYRIAHDSACMPPRLPPITAANCAMPSRSASRACASTQSSTVTSGKSPPQLRPVSGLIDSGPVEPKQLPRLFTPTTKNRRVSTGLPGPIMLSHQPTFSGSFA